MFKPLILSDIQTNKFTKLKNELNKVLSNESLNKIFNNENLMIAGGIVLSILDNDQELTESHDIDIFISNPKKNVTEIVDELNEIFNNLKVKSFVSVDHTHSILSVFIPDFYWSIQIIISQKSLIDIIDDFDFDVSKCFIYKNEIYAYSRTIKAIDKKIATFDSHTQHPTRTRVTRFMDKNFFVKNAIIDFNVNKYHKKQLILKKEDDDLTQLEKIKEFKEKTFKSTCHWLVTYHMIYDNSFSSIFSCAILTFKNNGCIRRFFEGIEHLGDYEQFCDDRVIFKNEE